MSIQWIICCLGSVVLLLAIVGCHESTEVTSNASGLPKLGDLWDLAQISTAPDSDGDFIPDDVEIAWLHTDPKDRDTDHDGLPDNYEVFGLGLFDRDAWVPDLDQDGKIAALDNDDDDDQVNDGLYIDTDEDGIANYLEFYGYIYDWMTGMFLSCEDINCTGATVYKSDPLQPSTDQDAYSDAMEVSGLRMDVSVDYPGQNPLVPAYPNLVVELVGYSVTLNEDIEYGKGGSLSKGTEWSTGTERSHTFTSEGSWTAGIEVGDENKFSTSFTLGFSNSNTTTHSVSKTTSVTSEVNWSESRSSNPTDAAHVKLLLKVHNYGTACASNIIPTLTLRVAGLNVTTFEPGNAQINMLVPGATYPEEDGVFWVVDSTDSGGPISLTMTELRAFESGAPISVVMTQVQADVLLLNNGGAWEQVGACNEYLARCDAACANLRLDMGEGSFLHTMVYSGNSPSSPVVTLRDELRWTAD
ncbi:MAG: binary toxin-like calcium binding domain-containing protein, partial [Planctomycetota bacterium]